MKAISARFPEAMYVVLGQTHPNLIVQEGEKYRSYLQQLIDENDLQKNVRLVNEYVPVKKLSAGCAIISNAFVLAKEMLDEETGIILETTSEQELADNAIRLFENDALRIQMGHNAFLKTRETAWPKVADMHSKLFCDILGLRVLKPIPVNQFIH
jgi:glycosyltransferase involved in cell wall biosynthesis